MLVPQTEITVRREDGAVLLQKTVPPGDYVLGRVPEVELSFEADLVSRRHAQLTINFDHAFIQDLGSSNGTLVNGRPITEITRLWPNQKIQIGAATVELRRVKTVQPPDVSLAPAEAAVQRLLPEELLRERKYDIGKVVAQGGMGAILNAKDAATERTVAMKVMLDGSSPDALARFVAEARVTAQLEHPNIVPVHELSVDENGQPYYTMKMVRGITLRKVLELLAKGVPETARKYPLPALLTIFQKACDALAFAHSKGVIHRDLKPENLMLDDFGVVLVMDWGLAKVLGKKEAPPGAGERSSIHTLPPETSGATLDGTIMGTPAFMSPEQARGEVEGLDPRSDIYALGSILFQILHLRPPYSGRSVAEIVDKVQRGEVAWPDAKSGASHKLPHLPGGSVPDSLFAVCKKALAFDRSQRYSTIEELQRDLAAYQTGFATSAEKASAWKQIMLLVKRHKTASLGIAAVLLVGSILGSKALVEGRRAQLEGQRAELALADLKRTAPDMLALAASEAALQRFDSALGKTDTALALDRSLAAAYWRRGWILLAKEKLPEALEALRLAKTKDPTHHDFAELIPLVEQMAAAPEKAQRSPDIVRPIYDRLAAFGATGESTPFIRFLKQTEEERAKLVQQRLEKWLGKSRSRAGALFNIFVSGNVLYATISNVKVGTLEPLRGLPIEALNANSCGVTTLEPLRGMRLVSLNAKDNPVTDLSPLHGMPLENLNLENCLVRDISPLIGMELKSLRLSMNKITDLRPLVGMPLETLTIEGAAATDFSPLHGTPLRELDVNSTSFSDGGILAGMPLTKLNIQNTRLPNLSALEGLPLKELDICRPNLPISDLTPLLRVPTLERLSTSADIKALLPLRNHPGLKEIKFNNSRYYRPVAEFWAEYDAQQAAEKK